MRNNYENAQTRALICALDYYGVMKSQVCDSSMTNEKVCNCVVGDGEKVKADVWL